jgi:hypothetical protein
MISINQRLEKPTLKLLWQQGIVSLSTANLVPHSEQEDVHLLPKEPEHRSRMSGEDRKQSWQIGTGLPRANRNLHAHIGYVIQPECATESKGSNTQA